MAHFCAAATGPSGRSAWSIIPPPLTPWQVRHLFDRERSVCWVRVSAGNSWSRMLATIRPADRTMPEAHPDANQPRIPPSWTLMTARNSGFPFVHRCEAYIWFPFKSYWAACDRKQLNMLLQ